MSAEISEGVGMAMLGQVAADAEREDKSESDINAGESESNDASKKRHRSTKLETAEKKLRLQEMSLNKYQAKYAEYINAGRKPTEQTVKNCEKRIEDNRVEVERAKKNLELIRVETEKEATRKAAAEAARAKNAELSAHLSEAAVILLVELRMKHDKHITDTVEKNDSVWEGRILPEYTKAIEEGVLAESDKRTVQGLKSRFDTELGEFRLWCHVANKAHELSGVPRDDLIEKVSAHRRPTTSIFLKHNFGSKPMSCPPFRMNGEGVTASVFAAGTTATSATEQDEEDDDDADDSGCNDDLSSPWDQHVDIDGNIFGSNLEYAQAQAAAHLHEGLSPTFNDAQASRRAAAAQTAQRAAGRSAGAAKAKSTPSTTSSTSSSSSSQRDGKHAESALDAFATTFATEQAKERALLRELERNRELEAEKQRTHEKEMLSKCPIQ